MTRQNKKNVVAATKIAKWFRVLNSIDPITFENVRFPFFEHRCKKDGTVTYYSAKTLALFILETGDYRSPITRKEFSDAEILQLQKASGFNLLECRETNKKKRQEEIHRIEVHDFHQNDILSLLEEIISISRDYSKVFTIKMVQCMLRLNTLKKCIANIRYVSEFSHGDTDTLELIILTKVEDVQQSEIYCDELIMDSVHRHMVSAFASLRQPLHFTPINFTPISAVEREREPSPLPPPPPLEDEPEVAVQNEPSEEYVSLDDFMAVVQRVRQTIRDIEEQQNNLNVNNFEDLS